MNRQWHRLQSVNAPRYARLWRAPGNMLNGTPEPCVPKEIQTEVWATWNEMR
jgi:hypothetical protein